MSDDRPEPTCATHDDAAIVAPANIDRLDMWLVCVAGLLAYLIAVLTFTVVAPDWALTAAFWRARRQAARRKAGES